MIKCWNRHPKNRRKYQPNSHSAATGDCAFVPSHKWDLRCLHNWNKTAWIRTTERRWNWNWDADFVIRINGDFGSCRLNVSEGIGSEQQRFSTSPIASHQQSKPCKVRKTHLASYSEKRPTICATIKKSSTDNNRIGYLAIVSAKRSTRIDVPNKRIPDISCKFPGFLFLSPG